MKKIEFGTSGHRGIMGKNFTHAHLIAISQSLATYLNDTNLPKKIILGYDPRKGNDPHLRDHSFTKTIVDTLISQGISVYFCDTYCPTPVISFSIPHYNLSGGLILTASHNPPEYNGLKFNPINGAPAPTHITNILQKTANTYLKSPPNTAPQKGQFYTINPTKEFAYHIKTLISLYFPKLNSEKITLIVDCKHGATSQTWIALSQNLPINIHLINDTPHSDFGNTDPNPTQITGLSQLKESLHTYPNAMGIANDPDGDRHILLDENGNALTPEETSLIIAAYLLKNTPHFKGIVSTVASSMILKEFTQKHHLSYEETPVGFKYFSPYFEKAIKKNNLILGIESSGGLSLSSHTQEKCGFLPGLMVAMISKVSHTPISKLKELLYTQLQKTTFLETSMQLSNDQMNVVKSIIKTPSIEHLKNKFTSPLLDMSTKDGLKLIFKESWILFRPSGTEPVLRLYVETLSQQASAQFLKEAQEFIHTLGLN